MSASLAMALGTVTVGGSAACGGQVDEPRALDAGDAADAVDAGGFLPGLCADVATDVPMGGLCPPAVEDTGVVETDGSRDAWGNCIGK